MTPSAKNGAVPTADVATIPLIIDGEEVFTDDTFDVTPPATGDLVHRCSNVSKEAVQTTIDAASRAFRQWSQATPRQRRDIFHKAAAVMETRRDELVHYMVVETGATQQWAGFNVDTAKDFILDIAGRIATIKGCIPQTQVQQTRALVQKEPFGVILAIAPWNAPYILGVRSIAGPIAAGNAAILKGSELSPKVMHSIVSVFQEAGLPRAHSQPCRFQDQLHRKHRVIGSLAGKHLKPVLLELGGKAPAIVWEDADLDAAAHECALGAFLNSGQICMSTERILVHYRIKAQFEQRLIAAIERIVPVDDDAPLLINAAAVARNKRLLEDALQKGAALVYGGSPNAFGSANRMRPLVLSDITRAMDIYSTESFGPSVSLYTIESEEEALELANDTEYGLSAAVFTGDLARGLRLASGISSGAVHINSMTVHDESALPHGGVKSSGFGRFNGSSLEEWVRTKAVTFRQ